MRVKDTVLVVDDQPGIRRLLTEVLSDESYEVITANNGNTAIEMLAKFKPAVILLDMKMPGMDGLEVLQEIVNRGTAAKVIMMTAYGEAERMKKAKEIGAHAYITKPFDIIELCNIVEDSIIHNDKGNSE